MQKEKYTKSIMSNQEYKEAIMKLLNGIDSNELLYRICQSTSHYFNKNAID